MTTVRSALSFYFDTLLFLFAVCLIRTMNQHEGGSNVSANVAVAILECKTRRENGDAWSGVPEDGDMADFYISDMDFFDEQSLVIVYSVREGITVSCSDCLSAHLLIMIDDRPGSDCNG